MRWASLPGDRTGHAGSRAAPSVRTKPSTSRRFALGQSARIELLEPSGDREETEFLRRFGPGIWHARIGVHGLDEKAEEGCLSIPDIYGDVERRGTVTIRATDENGVEYEATGQELLGRCFQHEIDHLDGKLFIDYLSPLKRKAAMAKWEKAKAEYPGFIRKVRTEVKGEHHHETEM